jgi:hypothetical protein
VIDFFTNDLEANGILEAERGVPVAGKVLAALKSKLGPAQVEAFELIDRVAKDARPLPPQDPPQWSTILSTVYLPKVTIPILRGELDPAEGVALFKREANAILAGAPIDGGAEDGGIDAVDGGVVEMPDAAPEVPPDSGDASGMTALLVVGAVPVAGKDVVLKARLEMQMGVEVVLDSAATTQMATGKTMVVISATSTLANVSSKFRDVTVPVLTTEPNILPLMGMTADVATDHDGLGAQTQISIVAANATHTLAAGLTGDVTVFAAPSRVTFGVPGPGALKIASVLDDGGPHRTRKARPLLPARQRSRRGAHRRRPQTPRRRHRLDRHAVAAGPRNSEALLRRFVRASRQLPGFCGSRTRVWFLLRAP